MEYYSIPTRMTEIKAQDWIKGELKYDIDFLFDCVKSILIHPIDTKKYNIKYNRTENGIFHAYNTSIEQILKYEKLRPFLKEKKLPLKTKPQDRAILSCDHHALLFTSFVRNLGKSIRSRTGFSKYIKSGLLIPHWITEIYDTTKKEWILIDPERQIKKSRERFIFNGWGGMAISTKK